MKDSATVLKEGAERFTRVLRSVFLGGLGRSPSAAGVAGLIVGVDAVADVVAVSAQASMRLLKPRYIF